MTHARPFRFGVQAATAPDRSTWVELARRTEALGYSTLTMPDHFNEQLAPVPALMTAADATTSLRIGALVWDNDYKHPLVLAKELATMDLLSEGRLEIGIGAGWMRTDYEQAGMPYDRPGVRVDRFEEGLAIIKGLMGPDSFSFTGEHYTITEHNGTPKPPQRPYPPILIGGGGKRVLSIAAREADIIGINASLHAGEVGPDAIATMTAESVDEKLAIVKAAAGARYDQIEMNVRAFMVNVTEDRGGAVTFISQLLNVEPQMVEQTPFALLGPTSSIIEQLLERRERWDFSYVIVGADDVDSFAPVVAELAGR